MCNNSKEDELYLYKSLKLYMGSKGLVPVALKLDNEWCCLVNFTSRLETNYHTPFIGGWVGRFGLGTLAKRKSFSCWYSNTGSASP